MVLDLVLLILSSCYMIGSSVCAYKGEYQPATFFAVWAHLFYSVAHH